MYAKIFRQIYDSSIAEDPQVRFTFMDMLVLADSDGVVDMTPEAISRVTNVPIDWVKRSIQILESPDERSRTADHNGARIARLDEHRDWGWVILNYDKFREMATEEQRRLKTRERVQRHREQRTKKPQIPQEKVNVTLCNADVTPLYASAYASPYQDKGVQGEKERPPRYPLTVDSAVQQCSLCSVPREFVMHCYDKAESRGGCDSKEIPIADFPAHVRTEWRYEQNRVGRDQAQAEARGKPYQATPKKFLTPIERTIKQAMSNYKP